MATATGATRLARRLARDRVAIVAYHNVVSPEEAGRGDSSLHLPLSAFIAQIERLRRTHHIVPLASAGEATPSRRPRAVVTFDDAYRGAVTLALPELTRRGIPATVFVSPELLGSAGTWWDVLGEAGVLTEQVRTRALVELQGKTGRVFDDGPTDPHASGLPAVYGIATAEELLARVRDGITLGSHAWAHEHLPDLPRHELERSLTDALEWVRGLGDRGCPWLALPYGAGSSQLGREALRLGYEGVLRVSGGLWRPSADRSFVPRINVPAGLSIRGFEMRTSGLLNR